VKVEMRSQRKATGPIAALALATLIAAPARAAEELVLIPDGNLLLVLIGLFVVLIFPVNALIFKPIFRALDERAGRIDGARQRASHIDDEASQVLGRYEEAIREARGDAETGRKAQISEARDEQNTIAASARSEAEQKVEQARGELARALEEARQGLRASAESLARDAAQKILGRAL
jgi:F-type H+-transporting ATPase subunit b